MFNIFIWCFKYQLIHPLSWNLPFIFPFKIFSEFLIWFFFFCKTCKWCLKILRQSVSKKRKLMFKSLLIGSTEQKNPLLKKSLVYFSLTIHLPCQVGHPIKIDNTFQEKPKEYLERSAFLSCSDIFISDFVDL